MKEPHRSPPTNFRWLRPPPTLRHHIRRNPPPPPPPPGPAPPRPSATKPAEPTPATKPAPTRPTAPSSPPRAPSTAAQQKTPEQHPAEGGKQGNQNQDDDPHNGAHGEAPGRPFFGLRGRLGFGPGQGDPRVFRNHIRNPRSQQRGRAIV